MLARSLGIACPATYMLCEHDRIEDVAVRVQYPVVIKPRWSRYQRGSGWVQGTVQYAQDANELTRKYREIDSRLPQPLVQETILGEGRGVFLLLWDGELKAAFCHRRLREKPPSGGVSVLCESIPLDDDLVGQSLALLKAIGWQGVAMVEFKVDQRDGRAKLMEINGRFWGSLQLAVDAGMDFPVMLYRLATGENVASQFSYRVGVKTRWLLGDLDQLLIRLRHRGNSLVADRSSRVRACLEFLKFYDKDMHYEVFKLDDPYPGWVEAKHWVQALFGTKDAHGAE
jgi:predicted ATP-grasp superfamily ATP-dependent carboligase